LLKFKFVCFACWVLTALGQYYDDDNNLCSVVQSIIAPGCIANQEPPLCDIIRCKVSFPMRNTSESYVFELGVNIDPCVKHGFVVYANYRSVSIA
jgi:hypothetical protein